MLSCTVVGYDVFISCSSKHKSAADAICAVLEADGLRCWIAPRNIVPGKGWADSIVKGLADSRMMLLVFSARTNGSQQIRREVERAVQRRIPIAPVRVEDVMPEGEMKGFLSSRQWMDARTPPFDQHLPQIASQVRALLQPDITPASAHRLAAVSPPPQNADAPAATAGAAGISPDRGSFAAARKPRNKRRTLTLALALAVVLGSLIALAFWRGLWRQHARSDHATSRIESPPSVAATASPLENVAARASRQKQQRLDALRALFLAHRVTADQYDLGVMLLKSDPAELSDVGASRHAQFVALLEGKLAPEKLAAALAPIESPHAPAATGGFKDYEVKAAFLFHFAELVEWPDASFPNAAAPLGIGVLGDDPFGGSLDQIVEGETVRRRSLQIKRSNKVADLMGCQIIFISASEAARVEQILTTLGDASILTVSEVDGFIRHGGVLNFYPNGNKVGFEINPDAAKRHGLKISQQLINVGKVSR